MAHNTHEVAARDPLGDRFQAVRHDNGDRAWNERANALEAARNPEQARLDRLVREVRLALILRPIPAPTGNVEVDTKALLAWADERARNIVSGVQAELAKLPPPPAALTEADFANEGRIR